MISMDGNDCRGSARSIKNFHLFEVLNECSTLLKNYGGHSHAAGLSLHKGKLVDFKEKINRIAHERIVVEDLVPSIDIDMEIAVSSLNKRLLLELDELSPFGLGNPQPVFVSRGLNIKTPPQIIRRGGIKMWVSDGGVTAEAIGFNMADDIPSDPVNQKIDIAYTASLNTYKGITSIQLNLKDIKIGTGPFFYPSDSIRKMDLSLF
jgi:single-stranded-DNA-specific exonuclease